MGLLDLVDLALNVQQSNQLRKTHDQLQQLQLRTLHEGERREYEAEHRHYIESLRQVIFTIGQNLRTLDQHVETLPQPTYATAQALNSRLQESDIRPEIFPQFADKEYLQHVRDQLITVAQRAQQRLTPAQFDQAKACACALFEMPRLEQAIELRATQATLQQATMAWEDEVRRAKYKVIGGFALLFVSLFAATISPYLLFVLVPIGAGLLYFGNRPNETLKEHCDTLQKQIGDGQATLKQFQAISDLQAYRRERVQLIQQVMAPFEGYDQLLLNTQSVYTDGPTSEVATGDPDATTPCLSCGAAIPGNAVQCQTCGWSYEANNAWESEGGLQRDE